MKQLDEKVAVIIILNANISPLLVVKVFVMQDAT